MAPANDDASAGEASGHERRAVALRHERGSGRAPHVVAKGRGLLAERILALAREHDLPVREDADLLQVLSLCEIGDEIPIEVYSAVAEILAYLYRVNGDLGGSSAAFEPALDAGPG